MTDRHPSLDVTHWHLIHDVSLTATQQSWLGECQSMTARFERHCGKVTIVPPREGFIGVDSLGEELTQLPDCERFWLREVLLCGDNVPWLFGRTLIPETSLTGEEVSLLTLGTVPLGRYLFKAAELTRDFIQVGEQGELWARRSRLRLSGKPLLLTELFLSESPLYGVNNEL